MTLRFEDPGPHGSHHPHGATVVAEHLQELRGHPGAWAVIAVYPEDKGQNARSVAYAIRRGTTAAYRPAGCFETTTRRRGEEVLLYARYVGESEP